MTMSLTQAAMARLADMLMQQPQGGAKYGGSTFGGQKFGGNAFGGNKYGGNQFGASAPPAPLPTNGIPPALQNGVNTNRVISGMQPPPAVQTGTEPSPAMPQAPLASAVLPEGLVNQNPPVPNPPLAEAPPAVTSASFGAPPGAALPAGPPTDPLSVVRPGEMPGAPAVVVPPQPASGFPTLQASTIDQPSPVGTDPSMGGETVRQSILRAMKAKNMPLPQWAQNFGNLADQQG